MTTGTLNSIILSYNPGSRGGVNWTLNPDEWSSHLHNVHCGEEVKFPSIAMSRDTNACEPSEDPLTIAGEITSNTLTPGVDYTVLWDMDGAGNICDNTTSTCTISAGGLTSGATYQFKLELRLVCQTTPETWDQIIFTQFEYSPPLVYALFGSVTTITFPSVTTLLNTDCSQLLLDHSSQIGTQALCSMSTQTDFHIRYGHDAVRGTLATLSLNRVG